MVLCPTGSSVQSGAPAFFTFDQNYITASLPSTLAAWVTPWLLGLPTGPVDSVTFCATEPTGDLPTVADYAKLAIPLIALISGTYGRIGNQIRRDAFTSYCQCNSVPGGTCYAGWSPSFAFSNLHGSGSNAFTMGVEFNMSGSHTIYGCETWFPNAPNGATVHLVVWNRSTNSLTYQEDFAYAGSGYRRYLFTTPPSLTNGETYDTYYVLASSTNTLETTTTPATNPLYTFLRPTYDIGTGGHSNTTAGTWQPISPLICTGGAPPVGPTPPPAPPAVTVPAGAIAAPGAPTCATSQDICNYLAKIDLELQMVANLQSIVKDETVPTGYVEGTSHAGLTGNGDFAVAGILGLRVLLTTVPSWLGRDPGDPTAYFRAGWVNWGNALGWLGGYSLHHLEDLTLGIQPSTTKIGYSLEQGVVATIIEINR